MNQVLPNCSGGTRETSLSVVIYWQKDYQYSGSVPGSGKEIKCSGTYNGKHVHCLGTNEEGGGEERIGGEKTTGPAKRTFANNGALSQWASESEGEKLKKQPVIKERGNGHVQGVKRGGDNFGLDNPVG